MTAVVIDSGVLLLLLVGYTNRSYIAVHKRLNGYSADDFDTLTEALRFYDDIVVLPNTLTEVSNLGRHLANPAKSQFQKKFREFTEEVREVYVQSRIGSANACFMQLGLTDAAILSLCSSMPDDLTLITVDAKLLNAASSLGCQVIDFRDFME